MVFTQFGVAALAVAVVHLLEAAAKPPPITKIAAALFFAIAGRHSPLQLALLGALDSSSKQAMVQDWLGTQLLGTAATLFSCCMV